MNEQNPTVSHPDPETLGAFVEGTLDASTTRATTAHIALCNDCLEVVTGAVRFRREEDEAAVRRLNPTRRGWLAAAAVVVALVGLVTFRQAIPEPAQSSLDALRAAAPADRRYVQPRLSGFPWAPIRTYRDDGISLMRDPAYLRLAGAAGEALLKAQRDETSSDYLHAAGVGQLLLRQPDAATALLGKAAAREPHDATAWSDLAAARLTRALEEKRPSELPAALASADQALALDADLPEALFNRALILESLGLRADAVAAWRAYLDADGTSPWATEAREHLGRLSASGPATFRKRIDELEAAALVHADHAVLRVVDLHRQEARAWYEVEGLGQWAEAVRANDVETARRKLAAAAAVGLALERLNGESLLAQAVSTIASASGDSRRLRSLAHAHYQYREGRLLYSRHELRAAEAALASAANALAAHRSPMEGVARYYLANVLFDQSRVPEALGLLQRLLRDASTPALKAQVWAQIGLCELYAGRWTPAIDALEVARDAFARLGEYGFVGSMESKLAEAQEFLTRRDAAWTHRIAAFRALSAHPMHDRMTAAIAGAARAEAQAGRYAAALSLLDVELRHAGSNNTLAAADVWRRRAIVQSRLGDTRRAGEDLRQARAALAAAQASELRQRLDTELSVVEAGLLRTRDPRRAAELYSRAIASFETAGHRVFLPETLLERARVQHGIGRADDAARDLDAAIGELESQRGATASSELRARLFDQQSVVFEEAVALALERGDVPAAFAYADLAHGRVLLDRFPAPARNGRLVESVREQLRPGQALLEAMLVPGGMAVFVVTNEDIHVFRKTIDRRALEERVMSFRTSIEQRQADRVLRDARALHELLIEPARGAMDGIGELIVIGDRFLESVPWAALHDGRGWLVESMAITVAPSAAVWAKQVQWLRAQGRVGNVLVVADGGGSDLDPLTWTAREAQTIATMYGGYQLLADPTPERIVARASEFDVLHFSGHARAGNGDDAALLFSSRSGEVLQLSASMVSAMRLPRTTLVVLAACGTAAGEETSRLDGMPSLARAFLAAGVPSVVGSVWPLEDAEAAALVAGFHRRLRAGLHPSNALREAQVEMIRSETSAWRHPAAWAGLEVRGASAVISETKGT